MEKRAEETRTSHDASVKFFFEAVEGWEEGEAREKKPEKVYINQSFRSGNDIQSSISDYYLLKASIKHIYSQQSQYSPFQDSALPKQFIHLLSQVQHGFCKDPHYPNRLRCSRLLQT